MRPPLQTCEVCMLCIREAQEAIRPGRAFPPPRRRWIGQPAPAGTALDKGQRRHAGNRGAGIAGWVRHRLGDIGAVAGDHRPGLRQVGQPGTPGRHLDRRSGRRRHVDRHQLLADIKDIFAITAVDRLPSLDPRPNRGTWRHRGSPMGGSECYNGNPCGTAVVAL